MSLFVRTCDTGRMNVARIFARAALILGGIFWVIMFMAQATPQRYTFLTYAVDDVAAAGLNGILPLIIVVGVFVLALFYERLAAALLLAAAVGVVIWGIIAGWGAGQWVMMLAVMALPLVVSAVLLLLAASTQRVCELEGSHM